MTQIFLGKAKKGRKSEYSMGFFFCGQKRARELFGDEGNDFLEPFQS
jgi:hypothetical protein